MGPTLERKFKRSKDDKSHNLSKTDAVKSEVEVFYYKNVKSEPNCEKEEPVNESLKNPPTNEVTADSSNSDISSDDERECEQYSLKKDGVEHNEIQDIIIKEEPKLDDVIVNYEAIKDEYSSDNEESLSEFDENDLQNELKHDCPACGQTLPTIPLLRSHIIIKHTSGKECLICNEEFVGDMWRHCKSHVRSLFQCNICSKRLLTSASLQRHKKNHIIGKPHQCDICGKAFKTKDNLACHKVSHSNDRNFKCPLCPASFKRKCSIPKHLKLHAENDKISDSDLKCSECEIICRSKSSLKRHKTKIHRIMDACKHCSMKFNDKQLLRAHELQHTGNYDFKCETCEFIASSRAALEGHKRTHSGEKPFKCHICSRSFKQKHHLRIHLDRIHLKTLANESIRIDDLLCKSCGFNCKTMKELNDHHFKHTGRHRFQCTICPRVLSSSKNLILHKKCVHGKGKTYKCEYCGKSFTTKVRLNTHRDHHTSSKKNAYTCAKCQTDFSHLSSLRRHRKQTCPFKI